MTTRSCSMSSGQGLRTGRLRVKARTLCAFAAAACAASSSSLAVVTSSSSSNSSCSIRRAVRSERGPYSSRLSFSIRSSRCALSASLSDSSARALAASACQLMASACIRVTFAAVASAFGLDLQPRFAFSPQRLTFDQQRRLGAGKIRRKIIRLQTHEASESDFPVDSIAECYPTRVGRKVS